MLIKFETKSARVKGLAFHPTRPWILASLHNGVIQLWDYRMETLIDKFEEHDGPVRGINFHRSQPLFVSGGDDYKIKVWNYQQRTCLFNLLGHLDYIRTVEFHHEYPWILSASDDQTLRIWNWQSRTCLTVLTGHNHYVMCARFHPTEDLVLSASLDQSVRVWDISGLRKKNVSIASDMGRQEQQNELFGASDVVVKHVLEGHTRGVNWASFHSKLPLIVSGADDREVKLWRYNERRAWEVDTMRGHSNNVSCVIFHSKQELMISDSEDRTIRVWDMSKNQAPRVYRRERDRYWILDAHPSLNLLAAGHDSGLSIFKLSRERPPYASTKRELYYYKDLYIRKYEFKSGKDTPLLATRRRGTNTADVNKVLDYNTSNKSQHCILLTSDVDGSSFYELYVLPKGGGEQHQSYRGMGRGAVWISRSRFAVLDRNRQLWLKDLKNDTKRRVTIPNLHLSQIFPGGVGRLLIRTSDGMVLYDVQVLKEISRLAYTGRHPIKYVKWASGHKFCAMWSKAHIYITNGSLEETCSINETNRVKSGAWDSAGVFVYTTSTHIKYVLPNGDNGILRTLDKPVYITSVSSTQINYLDREGQTGVLQIDATEYLFKVALVKRRHKDVLRIMKTNKLVGQSIIAYLQKKGFPEVALHFVKDANTKFNLALECGNIKVALECAQELDQTECWHKLGVEALRQGNHQVVEAAYQKTKNFERLSFLYLITGNMEKLGKMLQISKLRQDRMGRFHNALYLGNVEERVEVLKEAGHLNLAYLTATAHGLYEQLEQLDKDFEEAEDEPPSDLDVSGCKLLFPPTPILREANWPLLEVSRGYFDGPPGEYESDLEESEEEEEDAKDPLADDNWGGDIDLGDLGGGDTEPAADDKPAADGGFGGWPDDDLGDLGIDLGAVDSKEDLTRDDGGVIMPLQGKSPDLAWQESALAAELVAAGAFDQAAHALNRQIGVTNFQLLEPAFTRIHTSVRVYSSLLPGSEPVTTFLERSSGKPRAGFTVQQCLDTMKTVFRLVSEGKLPEALAQCQEIFQTVPLVVCETKSDTEVHEMLEACREYAIAMRLELQRRQEQDPRRQCELAAYFTKCKLQPAHTVLGLKVAIKSAFQIKNFQTAASFARRVLELAVGNPSVQHHVKAQQIKAIIRKAEQVDTNAHELDYGETTHFDICARSLTAIHRGTAKVECPYCHSQYLQEHDGGLCDTCQLSTIGADCVGLQVVPRDA